MDQILKTELLKNSEAILKKAVDLSPSYQTAMKNALLVFDRLGIPSKNNEDWKYTNIAKNLSPRFYEQKESIVHDVPKQVLDKKGMIIFNNGIFNKFLSVLPDGIELDALVVEDKFFDTFDSLNFGVALSPLALKIKKNTVINFPITIVHLVDDVGVNKMISPRLSITAEENTKVSFLEIFSTSNEKLQYTTNAVTRFKLLGNAQVEHVKMQSEAPSAVHIGLTEAKVYRDSNFKSMTLDYGLLTARHNISVDLMEAGAEAAVHGLFALKNSEHTDIFSTITHFAPHTTSDQLFKGILGGDSHGIFTGKIIVEKDAQKSSSSQLNKNLILSKKAHIDTRPQLLVHADDVKCSHGATVGQLSKDEEFYLESRGIPQEKAKRMLCHGFAADVILKIENTVIKKLAEVMLIEHFEKTALSEMNL
jgi:Fe-S cluster assembly protein SufD